MNRYIQALLITTCLINAPICYAAENKNCYVDESESFFLLKITDKIATKLLIDIYNLPSEHWTKRMLSGYSAGPVEKYFTLANFGEFKKLGKVLDKIREAGYNPPT